MRYEVALSLSLSLSYLAAFEASFNSARGVAAVTAQEVPIVTLLPHL
jgi:hypothetical protein